MASTNSKKKTKRIFYLDALRALAIIAVISYHVVLSTQAIIFKNLGSAPDLNWYIGVFLLNDFRFGVDLFLILAGALSLGREWTIRSFLSRRIPRIVKPYLFWIFVTLAIFITAQYLAPDIFKIIPSLSLENIWNFVLKAFQSKTQYYNSYWFFWMILGTYFIMPIFNKWLLHAELEEAEYFLFFWLITALFTSTLKIPFPIKLDYFTGAIGFVVLGYYLRHTKRKIFDNIYVPLIMIIVPALLMIYINVMLFNDTNFYKFYRESIFISIEVAGIYLLFKNLDTKYSFEKIPYRIRDLFKKAAQSIAKYSYGFYLIHLCIFKLLQLTLIHYGLFNRFKLMQVTLFFATLAICWIVMALLNRVKYVNEFIGAK